MESKDKKLHVYNENKPYRLENKSRKMYFSGDLFGAKQGLYLGGYTSLTKLHVYFAINKRCSLVF